MSTIEGNIEGNYEQMRTIEQLEKELIDICGNDKFLARIAMADLIIKGIKREEEPNEKERAINICNYIIGAFNFGAELFISTTNSVGKVVIEEFRMKTAEELEADIMKVIDGEPSLIVSRSLSRILGKIIRSTQLPLSARAKEAKESYDIILRNM
jgi:hypothetical protein